jgi:lipopolysaccharide export system protein LptC
LAVIASLRLWFRDRKLPAMIVLVALAAGVAQLLLWWTASGPKENDFVGPPRSGYVLYNAKMWSYNPEGLLAFRMQAPHMERREDDETLYINAPVFQIAAKKPGIPDWDGHSLYGWVDKSGTLIKLQGPVHMQRAAYTDPKGQPVDMATLDTSEVTAWPKEDRMETAEAAHSVQGARTLDGIGMRANLNDNHLELFDASHGTFPPRPHPQHKS